MEIKPENFLSGYTRHTNDNYESTTAQEKQRIARHFSEYTHENGLVLDTDDRYQILDTVKDFFHDTDLTVSDTYLSHLRAFVEYIARHVDDSRAQTNLFDIKEDITPRRWPDNDEFEKEFNGNKRLTNDQIRSACHNADRRTELFIRFLFETGCRIAEARAVTPKDVLFDVAGVDVGAAVRINKKRDRNDEVGDPKTEKSYRTVELIGKTAVILEEWIDDHDLSDDDWVFWHSERTYQKDFKQAFTDAGVKINDGPDAETYKTGKGRSFVSTHWMRHNRNTRIREAYDKETAARYLGHHDDTDVNETYTHFDPDNILDVVEGW